MLFVYQTTHNHDIMLFPKQTLEGLIYKATIHTFICLNHIGSLEPTQVHVMRIVGGPYSS